MDEKLNHVKERVRTGNCAQCTPPAYLHVKEVLSTYGEFLLRGTRFVIPKTLQKRVLSLAHEGHQEIGTTKSRLRCKVWWLKIDSHAERLCKIAALTPIFARLGVPYSLRAQTNNSFMATGERQRREAEPNFVKSFTS